MLQEMLWLQEMLCMCIYLFIYMESSPQSSASPSTCELKMLGKILD